ncbi:MAG: hypothetical protein WBD55_05680 [Dehalococcoidia bacterium]
MGEFFDWLAGLDWKYWLAVLVVVAVGGGVAAWLATEFLRWTWRMIYNHVIAVPHIMFGEWCDGRTTSQDERVDSRDWLCLEYRAAKKGLISVGVHNCRAELTLRFPDGHAEVFRGLYGGEDAPRRLWDMRANTSAKLELVLFHRLPFVLSSDWNRGLRDNSNFQPVGVYVTNHDFIFDQGQRRELSPGKYSFQVQMTFEGGSAISDEMWLVVPDLNELCGDLPMSSWYGRLSE